MEEADATKARCRVSAPLAIGIVGGMSPESTVTYYQYIVRRHQEEFHNHAYPRIVVASVSFQQYMDWQHAGDWSSVAAALQGEFDALASAGAAFGLLATNTMHKAMPEVKSSIPILTIFRAVASEAASRKWKTLGLTGTKFTMSDGFYKTALEAMGLHVVLPDENDQEAINRTIYKELIEGKVLGKSVAEFRDIRRRLIDRGADAVLLGCTELQMLVPPDDRTTPILDSTQAHAEMAWRISLGREPLR
jgi:aspartate racemase